MAASSVNSSQRRSFTLYRRLRARRIVGVIRAQLVKVLVHFDRVAVPLWNWTVTP